METTRIAQILSEMGTLLEVRGENPFRCRAYHNVAQTLKALPSDLSDMIADGRLAETPGIGETMFSKIVQLATTGHLPAYDELRRATPPGLVALLRVPGLGPKKIKVLHDELKIESLADLRAAGEAKKIAPLKGFGAKTEQKILDGISFVESVGDRILQSKARRLVAPIFDAVRQHPLVLRAEICGSLRRRAETIGDLDILFSAENPAPVLDHFVKLPEVATVLAHGPTKASVRLADGVQCDLRGVEDDQFPFALHYFTGSKEHNIAIRRRALAHGYSLNEYSLSGEKGSVACRTEADLFAALGLAYIPPELREDVGEIEAAEKGPLAPLVELSDLTGTFHCHTDWSDGLATLEEMAEAARSLGLTYLGIADHSRSAGYAGGLSIERVRQQWAAIDALNETFGGKFRIFKGTECDILADGSLDYPDDILDGFDYVVASVHSLFGMPRDEMTARIVRAASNPRVTMLGHPTGRLLLARDAYAVDVDAVIDAAAKAGTMIEINANPHRLDLDAIHCRRAKARGVTIVVNPDAHATGGLADLDYGVGIARRAGLGAADLFNTASLAEVTQVLEKRRKAHH
ncbi:DNA polymerase/3'-5' exonuclease PolX [Singulisphaera sp. Ch08]|uniref:DNA polymerase beta n=1 Tax=Singulisphaera sp. Ch08 TaxID=3120278 RepID=A0AAU7CEH7_9BACT